MRAADLPQYLIASREGLYLADRTRCRRIAGGHFFGIALRDDALYAFRTVSLAQAEAEPLSGRIVRYPIAGGVLGEAETLVERLDHNCHQIEFHDHLLLVLDTHNQRVLGFDPQWREVLRHQLLPPAQPKTEGHAHANALLSDGDKVHVMLHNLSTGRPSEIVSYDAQWAECGRIALPQAGCHDIARLDDGALLFCNSFAGSIASTAGWALKIDDCLTRGIAIGPDEILVGSSTFGRRAIRAFIPGFLTFFDRAFQRRARVYIPAAPTQIRSLAGHDRLLAALERASTVED